MSSILFATAGFILFFCSGASAQGVKVTNLVFPTNQSQSLASLPKQQKPFTDSDLNECMAITMMMLDPMMSQDDLKIRRYCTSDFRSLLTKGVTPEPGGVCPLDSDFRFDSQDDTPLIEQVGPPEKGDLWIKIPVRMKKPDRSEITKVWIYERENALMRLCDVRTYTISGSEQSLAEELSSLK